MSEAAQPKKQQSMAEIVAAAEGKTRRNTATTTATKTQVQRNEKFDEIEANPFYQILFNPQLSPQEKKQAVIAALTYNVEEDKEKNAARIREFDVFKEYLQDERKVMAQELLNLVDTGTFSEMKSVIEDLNNGLIDFDQRMKPLTDILDAVYNLRMAGSDTVHGVFQEIQEDKIAEEELQKQIDDTKTQLQAISQGITEDKNAIYRMQETRNGQYRKFFGLGGLKETTIRDIAAKQAALTAADESLKATEQKIIDLQSTTRESKFAGLEADKATLRSLLDITSEEHTERQKMLISTVQHFINTTGEKTVSVQGQLEDMGQQVSNLGDANNGMRFIYTIVAEASGDAMEKNNEIRKNLDEKAASSTSDIEKLSLEQKKGHVDGFVTTLHTSTVETAETLGDLTTQGVRIKSMGDANREQAAMMRKLGSSGVSGMADRLVMAVHAVGAAATNESGQMTRMTLDTMNQKTNGIVAKEAIRAATNLETVAQGLEKAADDLVQHRELNNAASAIVSDNLAKIRESLGRTLAEAGALDASLKESSSLQADAASQPVGQGAPAAARKSGSGKRPSPFGKLS